MTSVNFWFTLSSKPPQGDTFEEPSVNLITTTYRDTIRVTFTEDGWLNATAIADLFGKRPVDWLKLDSTKDYIAALLRHLGQSEESSLWRSRRGGKPGQAGTWFHPKLGIPFARWLEPDFAVWCDLQIDALLRGQHPAIDWKRSRHAAASTNKVMSAVLQQIRERQGKTTASHHYSNEARLVNWVLTGEFSGLDRDSLTQSDLDLLAALEERNAVLIGCGLAYDERKQELLRFAQEQRPALAVH